ncbi:MAG: HAD family hydrolase [Tannerellaceae bacterium]|nr:HAD family hydrolase [Tannerellaceae bacterium]
MKLYISNNRISTIIFDMDGTLYPRNIYQKKYYDFTLSSIQHIFNKTKREAIEILKGENITDNPKNEQGSVSYLMRNLGMSIKDWNNYRDNHMDVSIFINANPKLVKCIGLLKEKFRLAVITNNTQKSTEKILSKIGFNSTSFDIIITSDSNLGLKPSPISFSHIKEKYQLYYQEMLSIGDRYIVDIKPLLDLGGNGIEVSTTDEIIYIIENNIIIEK